MALRNAAAIRRPNAAPSYETAEDGADLASLEALVGFNIHILGLLMMQLFHERFAAEGMTPGMVSTLLAIKDNPGIRAGILADALLIRRSNMTTLLDRLERAGHIRRRGGKGDQRAMVLHLSEKGARALDGVLASMPGHERNLTDTLDAAERATLLALLRRVAAGLRPHWRAARQDPD